MKVLRQGDIGVVINGNSKTGQAEKSDKILAHGEVTGHAHRISKGDALLLVDEALKEAMDSAREMQIKAFTPTEITHEEHEGITLPIGTHRVVIQREYDWATKIARKVQD